MQQYKDQYESKQNKEINVAYSCPCNLFVMTGYRNLSDALKNEGPGAPNLRYPYGEVGRVKNVIPHNQAFKKGYSYNVGRYIHIIFNNYHCNCFCG